MRRAVLALAAGLLLPAPAAQGAGTSPLPEPRPAAAALAAPATSAPAVRPAFRPAFRAALPAGHTAYANESLADLFVTLTHDLEWGGRRPNLVRYEAPVRVGLSGPGAERHVAFIDGYLAELRDRSDVPIALASPPHNLNVRFVPGDEFRARVPRHYCVVVPGAPGWREVSRSPRHYGARPFERLTAIEAMTVFIPDAAPAHLARACLVEEIAQALGPANDLYGLGPSIFNDDAAHLWPTRLDFLLLRVLYAPELGTGLDRAETRARARAALDRLNPEGRDAPPLPAPEPAGMADWVEALRAAFDRERPERRRLASAREALAMAAERAPGSAFHCRSLMAVARVGREDRRAALAALDEAARICAAAHGRDDIRLALIRLDQARLHQAAGRPSTAWGLAEGLESSFAAHGQEERLAALYDLQAAVLRTIQQSEASAAAQRHAAYWRAFALGRDGRGGAPAPLAVGN